MLRALDRIFIEQLSRWGVPVLRVTVAVVFLWFGALKLTGYSPVEDLVMSSFASLPFEFPFAALGVLEVLIGAGLLFKVGLRAALGLMWLMLIGTFAAVALNPELFIGDTFWKLTTEGEFVVKNLVLIAAGMVIGGHDVRPR
jgi:putative oxidoreductase